jgi:hypothetical protein
VASDQTQRKALRRQYKETARPAGVFGVRNVVDSVLLVGVSSDLPSMLNRQRFQLQVGSHPDNSLQADWQRLGPDSFSFEVIDRLEASEDPETDRRRDLATLLELWTAKLEAEGQTLYATHPAPPRRR